MQEQSLTPIPYKERRAYLFSMLEELADNAVAIIPAHSELIRNDDVHFKFRQESSFYYLTGFEEPDSIAVLKTVKGRREYILFVRPKDLKKEIWTGYRAGVEGAVVKYGADKSFTVDEFESQLLHLLQGSERVFYDFHKTNNTNGVEGLDHKVLRVLNRYRQGLGRTGRGLVPLHSLHEMIGEMRLFKSPEEVERMRKAAQISAFAHKEAMAICRPGLYEYQIEALVEYHFRNLGCGRHGYPSIVATGSNATILHYVENNAQLKDGDLF